jgi:ADP-heptose:LPS heptosyltransferase
MQNFYKRTRDAQKILVMDLGFLGDVVHLIPALRMIKKSYINATIDVVVSSNVVSLLDCFPWINKTWGYTRYPEHASFKESFCLLVNLRKENYDILINLNGSDRSGWLGFLTGVPERLGRLTSRGERKLSKILFTNYVDYPYSREPNFIQRCRCLEKAGLPYIAPSFDCEIKTEFLKKTGISLNDSRNYFHVSPFTTANRKELPFDILIKLVNELNSKWPSKKIVLSCAPVNEEISKMNKLIKHLSFKPWRVYKGNLTLSQLVAIIGGSYMHISGDTGTLHIAVMTKTSSVSWFQPSQSKDWLPSGHNHKVLFGLDGNQKSNVCGIDAEAIYNAIKYLIKNYKNL